MHRFLKPVIIHGATESRRKLSIRTRVLIEELEKIFEETVRNLQEFYRGE